MAQAERMDGLILAKTIRSELATTIAAKRASGLRAPALAVVLVGEDPASQIYVRNKHRACEEAGIESKRIELPAKTTASDLHAAVRALNDDEKIDGILVQLPLPGALDAAAVRAWIAPEKDVDGLHANNAGLLAAGTPRFVPCTPAGCLELLRSSDIQTSGKHAVVIGRSLIVGRPMATLLSSPGIDATVTICHSRTRDLVTHTRSADIIVAAAGVPEILRAEHVQPGAAVLDVGIHRVDDASRKNGYRLVGDVHSGVAEIAAYLSPVPGGVGPMTIAMLLRNTVDSYLARATR